MRSLRHLIWGSEGQDLAEYGIALAVIGVAVALLVVAISDPINTLWSNAQPKIEFVTSNE